MSKISRIKTLVEELNRHRDAYYNDSVTFISDKEYDELFDELSALEKETGFVLSNSPTQTVGYEVKSELNKVTHCYPPMLSLDKTKDLDKVLEFIGPKETLVMAKMDGLTCRITYNNGILVRAETRGDGVTGEDITHNIKVVKNVPLTIDYKDEFIVDGELIVDKADFEELREKFVDKKGKKYKNARNFAAGSVRLLDSSKCAERRVQFVAWKLVKGSMQDRFTVRLMELADKGFTIVPYMSIIENPNKAALEVAIDEVVSQCEHKCYGIDGCVFSYVSVSAIERAGYTDHHWRGQFAYKFYDDKYDTTIYDIDWTMGKTGILTPTAIFETVEIDGTDVSRASLHNLTIMKQLNVRKNCSAKVFKANMIIPQVDSVENDGTEDFMIPSTCPICGGTTAVVKDNDSEMLMCINDNCSGKLLGKLCTFVSKQCMNIDGLSEGKLIQLINQGYVNCFEDIYDLDKYKYELMSLPGWGNSSVTKLLDAIEKSKSVKFPNFLAAMSIPNLGLESAKTLCEYFNNNVDDIVAAFEQENFAWSVIPGFGNIIEGHINDWYQNNFRTFHYLLSIMNIVEEVKNEVVDTTSILYGKTFCITGTFNIGSRGWISSKLEEKGGIPVASVTKKTDVLFAGEKAGSKLNKAQELGIIIYNEKDLENLIK
jgi:DNA ligase (NAD+)